MFELLLTSVKHEACFATSHRLKASGLLGLAVTNNQLRGIHRHHRKRAGFRANNYAGLAVDAERHLDGQLAALIDVDCMRCAGVFAVAANRALAGIPNRSLELHVRSQVWVVLEGAHDQTAILREHRLPHVGGTQAHHVIKLRLEFVQRASVRVDAISDCLGARKNRR